jgi:hypothetical protein
MTDGDLDAAASSSGKTEAEAEVQVDAVGNRRRFCQLLVADGKYPNRSVSRLGAGPIMIGDWRLAVESTDRDRISEAARIVRTGNGGPSVKPDRVGI